MSCSLTAFPPPSKELQISASPEGWQSLAEAVGAAHEAYDGVVVTHAVAGLAAAAAAVAFAVTSLAKPVIFTGSKVLYACMGRVPGGI